MEAFCQPSDFRAEISCFRTGYVWISKIEHCILVPVDTDGDIEGKVHFQFDSGGRTFLQRGSPTPTSLASVARIFFYPVDSQAQMPQRQ